MADPLNELVDFWIDGRVYPVAHAVEAQFEFLRQLNATLVENCERANMAMGVIKQPLAPPNGRWTVKRKLALISAVRDELITREQALVHWEVAGEEFDGWVQAYRYRGLDGLRTGSAR